jgi:hypothetical protein
MTIATLDPAAIHLGPPPVAVDASLARLFAYWRQIRGQRPVPLRRDFDPLDIPYMLGRVMLIELRQEPGRHYFIRVHGTLIAWRLGYELTGKPLDRLPAPYRGIMAVRFDAAIESGMPHHTTMDLSDETRALRCETLVLPLSRDGSAIDMLLAGIHFLTPDPGPEWGG